MLKHGLIVLWVIALCQCNAEAPPVSPEPAGGTLGTMSQAPFSRVKFNAREQVLSGDMIRAQQLQSREVQDLFQAEGSSQGGGPMSALVSPTVLFPAGGFTMALTGAQAFTYDASITGEDNSTYAVTRWDTVSNLAFATPDGANPRVDLVIATPGSADIDSASRQVLVDPTLRTISPETVFKTTNPVAQISVITGTPAATPVPAALPSGAIALFEVWVPASAADSTAFRFTQRAWRRMAFPWSTMNGPVTGMRLVWDLSADPATTSSTLSLPAGRNRVVIDGEMIEFSGSAPVIQDSTSGQNPFTVSTVAYMRPYYIYAVGGRNAPQRALSGGLLSPIAVVESLIAPDLEQNGNPSSAIGVPGGTTIHGAVYIGIGFVVASASRRAACIMTDSMIQIVGGDYAGRIDHTKVGLIGVTELLGSFPGKPPLSTRAHVSVNAVGATGTTITIGHPDRGDGAGAAPAAIQVAYSDFPPLTVRLQSTGVTERVQGWLYFNPANAQIWGGKGANAGDEIQVSPLAYDHRVARLGF